MDSRHCNPLFQPTEYGGPKLVCIDLTMDRVVKKVLFPQNVVLPTTYLNDVCFDLRRGSVKIWYSSLTRRKKDRTESSSWTSHPARAGVDSTPQPSLDEGRGVANLSPDCRRKTILGASAKQICEPWCWHGLGRHHEDARVGHLSSPLCSAI